MGPKHSAAVGVPNVLAEDTDESRTELSLVRRAESGDPAAFRALYDAGFDFVFRTCLRLGLREADAEDAVQETFLVASRSFGKFQSGRLSTWLFRIAANVVSGRHRRLRVREALLAMWLPRQEQHVQRPDEAFDQAEAARQVAKVLSRMAPKKRAVFALYELEGLSGEEIAVRVSCPVATVWTRLHHARRDFERLARKLGLQDDDDGSAEASR